MKNNITLLYINTSMSENIEISMYVKSKIKTKTKKIIKGNMSNELLNFIDNFIKENKLKISHLDAISVYCGPGSYTSLRIGINTANTLGWVLNVPIFCIKNKQEFKNQIDNIKEKLTVQSEFIKSADAYYQQAL